MRARLSRLLLLAALVGCGSGAEPAAEGPRRPNVVLLISDDQDWEQLGFMGRSASPTPALDALAAGGTVFEVAHSAPRCRPTLAGLMSGRHGHQTGVYANGSRLLLRGANLLPRLLQRSGYRTYAEGKFWEGDPREVGFERGPGQDNGETGLRTEAFVRADQRELFDFLGQAPEQPFFVWWAPKLPHRPHDPPPELAARFESADVEVPSWIPPADRAAFVAAERTGLAMAAWLDRGVGQLMERLEELGRLEDTLFVFLIDNGWANGHVSKGSPYEKGVRTPIVLAGPGVPAGARHAQLASYVDVLPTVLDYVGLPPPRRCAGRSLRALVEGGTDEVPWRSALFGASYPRDAAAENRPELDVVSLWVREERWKYVRWTRDVSPADADVLGIQHLFAAAPERLRGSEELYDLRADPHERRDLAGDPAHAGRLERLRGRASAWWLDSGGRPLPD